MKPPPPEPAVTALARDVELLRRQLDALRVDVAQAQQTADAAHRVLVDLSDRVAAVADVPMGTARAAVDKLARLEPAQSGLRSWLVLEDREVAARLLGGLADWCQAVLLHYPGAEDALGECWMLHPAAVEELLALWYAWTAAYLGESASPVKVMDWHDRYRQGSVARLTTIVGGCSLADHRADTAKYASESIVGQELTYDIANCWRATHSSARHG